MKVYCIECKEHIYNLLSEPISGELVTAGMFVPANDNIPQPKPMDEILCPICGEVFMLHRGNYCYKILTEKGLLPNKT